MSNFNLYAALKTEFNNQYQNTLAEMNVNQKFKETKKWSTAFFISHYTFDLIPRDSSSFSDYIQMQLINSRQKHIRSLIMSLERFGIVLDGLT